MDRFSPPSIFGEICVPGAVVEEEVLLIFHFEKYDVMSCTSHLSELKIDNNELNSELVHSYIHTHKIKILTQYKLQHSLQILQRVCHLHQYSKFFLRLNREIKIL